MFCGKCGKEINDEAVVCVNCGCEVKPIGNVVNPQSNPEDASSVGFNILSFFIPLVGLILFAVWNSSMPKKAKGCGKWALIGFILGIVGTVLLYALGFAAMMGSGMY